MAHPRRSKKGPRHRKHAGHHVLGTYGVIVLSLVSVVALGATAYLSSTYLQSGQMAAVISSALVHLTNDDREQQDLGTLTVNPTLVAAAQAKADDMAKNGYFAHTSPDGKNSWYWFKQKGYSFTYAGENLAVDFSDSDAVENAWMNSPTHRANILNGHFTEIGIATAQGTYEGHKTTFVVQMFGTPSATPTGPVQAVNTPVMPTEIAIAKTDVLGEFATTKSHASSSTTAAAPVSADAGTAEQSPAPAPAPQQGILTMLVITPESLLRDLYLLVGAIVLVALVSITGLELKKHQMRYVAAAAFLFVLMGSLYLAADRLVFSGATLTAAAAISIE